jgi:L-gulonate 5-dehydrogenase
MICNVLKDKNILVMEERPMLEPRTGQVRIKTVLAGICGSDIHALHGMQPSLLFPTVMGHELVGVIDAIAASENEGTFKVGDRVVIDPSFRCGKCDLCLSGKENICEELRVLGVHCDGGFADYFLCEIDMLHKIPDSLRFEEAIFSEPLSIAMHAISRITSTGRKKTAIIGAGPIGLALLIALKELFEEVLVFEVLENRKSAARIIGADQVLDSVGDTYPAEDIDVVFDTVSIPSTVTLTERIVKRGGEVIIVGMAKPEIGFQLLPILKKELSVRGTRMTRREDFKAALDLLTKTDPKLIQAIITGYWSLSDSIKAIRYTETHAGTCIKEVLDFRR